MTNRASISLNTAPPRGQRLQRSCQRLSGKSWNHASPLIWQVSDRTALAMKSPPSNLVHSALPARQPLSRLPPQSAVERCGATAGSQSRYPPSLLNERPAASTFYNSPPPKPFGVFPAASSHTVSLRASLWQPKKLSGGLKPGECAPWFTCKQENVAAPMPDHDVVCKLNS